MANLLRANQELFRRSPDECFESLDALSAHCRQQRDQSQDRWEAPANLNAVVGIAGGVSLSLGGDGASLMNDWSFGQLCRLAGVAKETVNRLRPETACRVFSETLPRSNKPVQLFTQGDVIRSIHGSGYTRLHDADVVDMIRNAAVDFEPPQKGFNGATGLYAGEQDLFCFLIDPLRRVFTEALVNACKPFRLRRRLHVQTKSTTSFSPPPGAWKTMPVRHPRGHGK